MNKISKILTITAVAFAFSMNNFAMSKDLIKAPTNFSVAVVDIPRLIESSPDINALRIERKNKLDDLNAFAENARASVAKETSEAGKKNLEDKYNKELNTKKDAMDKDYAKKLADIDKNITGLIKNYAKKTNYDLVLTKSSVLDGGNDITSEIIKELK